MMIGIDALAVSCAEFTTANKPSNTEINNDMTSTGPVNFEFDGTIDSIDAVSGSITVGHWPLTRKFKVPTECEVEVSTKGGDTLVQLKVNDPVSVAYSEVGTDLIANRIRRRGRAYDQDQREKMERLYDMVSPSPNGLGQ
jgi:hypothetical protein